MNIVHDVVTAAIWIAALIGGFLVIVIGKVLLDMATKEATGQIDRLPMLILKIALLRLPADQRERYAEVWQPELTHILKELDSRPISRLQQGLWFATSLALRAQNMRKALGVPSNKPMWLKVIGDMVRRYLPSSILAGVGVSSFVGVWQAGGDAITAVVVGVTAILLTFTIPSVVIWALRRFRRHH